MKPFHIAVLVNFLFLIFRIFYVLLYPIDLSPEEAQYWDWSRHPDLSYYSKPPIVAYLNMISTAIFGNTEIGVRINPILMSFVLSILVFLFVRKLFDEITALFSSIIPNLFVGTAINSILMTTDAPLLFFWGISVMLIYFAVEKNNVKLWLLAGIFAGIAFLSKYPAVFLMPLTLLYLSLTRRDLLFSSKPYVSLIPAFILSLPVLIWNIQHDFVSFKHVSSLADKGSRFPRFDTALEFIGGQLLLLSVFPFFFLIYGWWKSLKKKDRRLIFLTVYSFPVVLFFLILSLRKGVYANWAGFGYFTGAILSTVYMKRLFDRSRFFFYLIIAFCVFLVTVLHFTPLIDLIGLRKLLPPKRDPVKVMIGWEKLGKEVSGFYTGRELVFSIAYQISAELAFYMKGNPRTFVFHTGRMTQYFLWEDLLPGFTGRDALFVNYGGLPEAVKKNFASYEFLKRVDITWRGERIVSFNIYRLRGFKGEFHDTPKGY